MDIFGFSLNSRRLIVGVGSALMDILAHESDDFVKQTGGAKGGMTLVNKEFIDRTLALASGQPLIVPGGSACNTVVGVGKLGGKARFVGKCGNGTMGQLFESDLRKQNVEPVLLRSDAPTGRVLSIITPDAQRSMFTYLGASAQASPQEISGEYFDNAAIVHVEGYLLFNPDLILATLKAAKASGAIVSLDLASFTVVEASRSILKSLIADFVDIIIANQDEARAYTGYADERTAIEALAETADVAVLKVGARGSFIAHEGDILAIRPVGDGRAIDTTGAGDLWASGFLFGLVNGYALEKCGALASACGYEVCQVIGANIPEAGWQRIKKLIE
ncbi:MAG: adenosine kinase [Desulfobacterales bacterium]|nr:MAG: adenosine kinase [Desulfobacterales bacterium]